MSEPVVRVLQIMGPVITGGVDGIVMNYYRNINRDKVQFDFVMDGYSDTPVDEEIRGLGGRIYKVEPYTKNIIRNQHQIYRILKENTYQIVHSHMNSLSVFNLMQAKRAGVPVRIAHSHSTSAKGEGLKTVVKDILRPYAKVFSTNYGACSELAGKWLFGKHIFDDGKVFIMTNAIDVSRFTYRPEIRNQVRAQLGLDGKLVIGHVGRFVYQKNHDFLIDIFRELHNQNPDARLVLIGSGELESKIRQKVEDLGLGNSVLNLGIRKDVPELMQAMDAFLLPSHYEGLPVVGVEAQAAGLPCFFSDVITREVKITDFVSFFSLTESPNKWAKKILCATNTFSRQQVDGEIRSAGFEIRTAARQMQDYYCSLL